MNAKTGKVVYLLRHGQSIDNASPVFQSEDSPLSHKGQEQALEIANRVSKLKFDALISSPLPRAKETAEFVSKACGKELILSELFVERRKPTSISSKSWHDDNASSVWRKWEKSLYTSGLRVEDGENFDDILQRADDALTYLNNRSEDSIVVVSHGYFLRSMVLRVLMGEGLTSNAMKRFHMLVGMENTGLTVLRYKDAFEEDFSWRLWTYNDHSHFAE